MLEKSKWIWTDESREKNLFVRFETVFYSEQDIKDVVFHIAAETKYYLYLNGVLTVFDGGLHRESTPGNGYYDEVKLNVKSGQNVLNIDVWYWGNGGRNNTAFSYPGLIFACDSLGIYSDERVKCGILRGYYNPQGLSPSYLYGGYNIGFDAGKDSACYKDAAVLASYGEQPYGIPEKRPIPLFRFSENISAAYKKSGNLYSVRLPHAMQFSPFLKVVANGGEKIEIKSDRYYVNGGPGDCHNQYRGHSYEYVCKNGIQEHSFYNYIFGESIEFSVPDSVKVLELGYRESTYDCDIVNVPQTDDQNLNVLLKKCARTLTVCMRENFMDCPDRERGQWIGDVSVQAPQVFYCLSENAVLLLLKAILDFIRLRKGNVLVGNVPGMTFSELPSQSLNAISEEGMISVYYKNTGDKDILRLTYRPIAEYLRLWDMGKDGFVINRRGNWNWFDHNFNIDEKILENCWYYSALKFAIYVSEEISDEKYREFLLERKHSIEKNFESAFWKGKFYSSGDFADDRANAMAVISGLAAPEHFSEICQRIQCFHLYGRICAGSFMPDWL